ncbi:hypothetical protein HPB51_021175 [Rhipicephalus microplus]|uniref:Ima1 N-terminal domain-containing protein n=1 Tax=Rhipicephalus microplus TaxID=6941 RepID=A0A9J6F5X9_RHIMP|nr:hypothetical protein HPB51_021175 [Rhipicephalus microplus]
MILPVLAGAVLCVPVLLYSYKKIRPLFSVKVSCWFCGLQTVVPYGNINCWDCPSCEQYNGFKADGDYNKPIPAQFDEALNFTTSSCQSDSPPSSLKLKPDNQLCSVCNYHQLIKVRLLANFTPTEEPWKQRLRVALSIAASAMSVSASTMLLLALLESSAALTQYYTKLGLASVVGNVPSSQLLQPAGFVLAGGSVLFAGRRRYTAMENWLGYGIVAWCQLALSTSTVILGAFHTFNLLKSYLHGGAVRKLVNGRGSSLTSSPCSSSAESLSSSTYLPNWEASQCNSRGQFSFSDNHSTCSRQTNTAASDLSDRFTDVHISPESERSWTTSTWSKPTSLQEISQEAASASCTNLADGFGDNTRPSSILWPARLHFQQGSPWMTGGMWAMGGTRTSSNTNVLWGVRQSFGLLTPPPSLAGSAKHSSSGSIASAADRKQKKAEWCFFKQRDAFFSSSPDDTPIPEMRTPTPAETQQAKTLFSRNRSLPGSHIINDASTLRHRGRVSRETASSPVLNTQGRAYAKSSVSETSLVTDKVSGCEATPAASNVHLAKRPFSTLTYFCLVLSVVLNISLCAYFVFSSRLASIRQ